MKDKKVLVICITLIVFIVTALMAFKVYSDRYYIKDSIILDKFTGEYKQIVKETAPVTRPRNQ